MALVKTFIHFNWMHFKTFMSLLSSKSPVRRGLNIKTVGSTGLSALAQSTSQSLLLVSPESKLVLFMWSLTYLIFVSPLLKWNWRFCVECMTVLYRYASPHVCLNHSPCFHFNWPSFRICQGAIPHTPVLPLCPTPPSRSPTTWLCFQLDSN